MQKLGAIAKNDRI